jgi:hypothetical protein
MKEKSLETQTKEAVTALRSAVNVDFKLIVNQQQINGRWEASSTLFASLGISEATLDKIFPKSLDIHVKLTLYILAWLDKFHSGSASAWALIKKKAESFLKSNGCKEHPALIAKAKAQI